MSRSPGEDGIGDEHYPPEQARPRMSTRYYNDDDDSEDDVRVIDASLHRCCWVPCALLHCGFWPYSTVLTLRHDTVTRHDTALCGERVSVRPYAELGTVQAGSCGCLLCVDYSGGSACGEWRFAPAEFRLRPRGGGLHCCGAPVRQTARGAAANRELQERVAARTEVDSRKNPAAGGAFLSFGGAASSGETERGGGGVNACSGCGGLVHGRSIAVAVS